MHVPDLAFRNAAAGQMQRAAIIPQQEIPKTPFMVIDEVTLYRMLNKLVEQRLAFILGKVFNANGKPG